MFTTRPDTLFGATYMVLAPEHPLVDAIAPAAWPDGRRPRAGPAARRDPGRGGRGVPARRRPRKSDLDRQENKDKTGVFTGAYAINPVNGERDPGVRRRLRADGLRHRRDHGRARAGPARLGLRARRSACRSSARCSRRTGFDGEAYIGDGPAINSANAEVSLNGLGVAEAKRAIIDWLAARAAGERKIQYKLRDWLFSRQRYWGEPFPIV